MDQFELLVAPRDVLGKRVKKIRRSGLTPANVYGHNVESRALQVETAALSHVLKTLGRNAIVSLKIEDEKGPRPVMIRSVQRDPVYHRVLHVDFYQVSMAEKMRAEVRLMLVGKAPAVDEYGGTLVQALENVMVEALPAEMPSHIEIDVSVLTGLESSVHVRDLIVDPNVTILTEGDAIITRVAAPRVVSEAEAAEEAAAAAEVAEAREEAAAAAAAGEEEKQAE